MKQQEGTSGHAVVEVCAYDGLICAGACMGVLECLCSYNIYIYIYIYPWMYILYNGEAVWCRNLAEGGGAGWGWGYINSRVQSGNAFMLWRGCMGEEPAWEGRWRCRRTEAAAPEDEGRRRGGETDLGFCSHGLWLYLDRGPCIRLIIHNLSYSLNVL